MIQPLKKGEIRLANLNPGKGTEPSKTRPVLILQNQSLLDIEHPSTLVIPLTTNISVNTFPLRIKVNKQDKLVKDSELLIDQLRAIDNRRLIGEPLTCLTDSFLSNVYEAVNQVIGMRE